MPHYPKPFFRPARGLWYVQIAGKQVNLGPDRTAAFKAYHGLMERQDDPSAKTLPAPVSEARLVVVVIDEFLEWCQKHRASHTYRWYKDRLNSFCETIDATLTTEQLKPHHVQKWVDGYPVELASGSRRNLIASVKRTMAWAEEQGYVERSPLAHLRKPACGRKEQIVSPGQYQALLNRTKDEAFTDLVTVTWETGCRPQESLRVEARHVDIVGQRWVFPPSEAKGKKAPRVVYLTKKALEVSQRLMKTHPEGPLFRNIDGKPWTPWATNCRFSRAKKATGVKLSLYAFRHTWINRKLLAGVDAFTVAVLAGHSDPSMLAKHYAHLSQAPGFLLDQARRGST